MQVGLECQKGGDEDVAAAMSKMLEQGYAPMRKIMGLKMWPKLELENSPPWAREKN
jgi:hypothetical protein